MEEECPKIKVKYLVSINRCGTVEYAKETIDLAIKVRDEHKDDPVIVGVELSGDPRSGKFEGFKAEFKRA